MPEIVYREARNRRRQAGVRCPRCGRVIAVEWDADLEQRVAREGHALRLGRCEGCFLPPGEGAGGEDLGGYVYAQLQPDGELAVGTELDDYCQGLDVLLAGDARCGCCQISVVRCGACSTPVATRHPRLESVAAYVECGYCQHCDRIVGLDVYERDGHAVREFVDRVASPDEIRAERWAAWRDVTQAELHDVDVLRSPRTSLPPEDLDLLEIDAEDVAFAGQDASITWEAWLSSFGEDLPPGVARPGTA